LPFYPSPGKDDGYDIADYRRINRDFGTLRDFRRFMTEAHRRGLRVITELVINHTSDQHPWFKRARRSGPTTDARNWYVWSDNDQRYGGRDGCPPGLARKNNGCLPPGQAMRVGERYSNQYARVPASYGERYRDTSRYLYRYNDGRIYQIERRTGVVVQVTAARR